MRDDGERTELRAEFRRCVSMAPKELEGWLESEESRSVGYPRNGRHLLALFADELGPRPAESRLKLPSQRPTQADSDLNYAASASRASAKSATKRSYSRALVSSSGKRSR